MKLSEKIMKGKETDFFCTSGMIVNSADRRVGANAVHGKGQLAIVSPGGMMYIPMPKENVVIAANDTEQLSDRSGRAGAVFQRRGKYSAEE